MVVVAVGHRAIPSDARTRIERRADSIAVRIVVVATARARVALVAVPVLVCIAVLPVAVVAYGQRDLRTEVANVWRTVGVAVRERRARTWQRAPERVNDFETGRMINYAFSPFARQTPIMTRAESACGGLIQT